MNYYLATERFRLVDKNQNVSVNDVLSFDDDYARASRSLSAALKARWLQKISEDEAKEYQKKNDKSRIKSPVIPKEKPKVEQPKVEEPKVDKMNENVTVVPPSRSEDDAFNNAVADEVFDQNKIIDTANARKQAATDAATKSREEVAKAGKKEEESFNNAIADEVIDQNEIIEAANARKKETKPKDSDKKKEIKDAIDKKAKLKDVMKKVKKDVKKKAKKKKATKKIIKKKKRS